jgi:hypothetical protein
MDAMAQSSERPQAAETQEPGDIHSAQTVLVEASPDIEALIQAARDGGARPITVPPPTRRIAAITTPPAAWLSDPHEAERTDEPSLGDEGGWSEPVAIAAVVDDVIAAAPPAAESLPAVAEPSVLASVPEVASAAVVALEPPPDVEAPAEPAAEASPSRTGLGRVSQTPYAIPLFIGAWVALFLVAAALLSSAK